MAQLELTRTLVNQLDEWVNELARPLLPLRGSLEPSGDVHLQFKAATAQAVMVGKLVRAASGIRAALLLVDQGFVVEASTLLRIVSDFCTEVDAVADGVRTGDPPAAVNQFVQQYFVPKPRTPEEFEAAEKTYYVSREELLKTYVRRTQGTTFDGERVRSLKRFLNMAFDSYVHGSYETTMELFHPATGAFMMSGNLPEERRGDFYDAVAGKLHEVVVAIEWTAGLMGNARIHTEARNARRALDAAEGFPPPAAGEE